MKMETKTIRKHRIFWTWQDEEEEAWLREMAQQGWHLLKPGFLGFYTFQQGESADIVYRLDFITSKDDREEYYQLFTDAGWELVGEMMGWQYFRKEARPGEELQIYTDPESKIQKYMRLFGYMIIFLPVCVVGLINLGNLPNNSFKLIFIFFFGVITLFWAYAFIHIGVRIQQLNRLRMSSKK
jgi:hypothetical protein